MNIDRPKSGQPIPENAKAVFHGTMFDTYQWEQELYDGRKKIFEKVKRPDTVVVYPVLPDGKIILTEQEQPGKEPFISATGGRVDEGEDVIEAAKRELLEEIGYEAEEFILWDAQQPVSKVEWAVYTFIAKGLRKAAEPSLDGGEKIKMITVSLDELIDIATNENKNFSERELVAEFFRAKIDPKKKEELAKLFKPI